MVVIPKTQELRDEQKWGLPSFLTYLHTLPVKFRLLIFRHCLEDVWQGWTPRLIKALRSDSQLYHEALEDFYAYNRLIVSQSMEKKAPAMPSTEIADCTERHGPLWVRLCVSILPVMRLMNQSLRLQDSPE